MIGKPPNKFAKSSIIFSLILCLVLGYSIPTYGISKKSRKSTNKKISHLLNQRSPQDRSASLIRMGNHSWLQGNKTQALRFYLEARQLSPDWAIPRFVLAHFQFGQGKFSSSLKILLEGVERYPHWTQLNVRLFKLFPDEKKFIQKRTLLERRVLLEPENQELVFLLVYIYYFSGQKDKSAALIQNYPWAQTFSSKNLTDFKRSEKPILLAQADHPSVTPAQKISIQTVVRSQPNLAYFEEPMRQKIRSWYPLIARTAQKHQVDPLLITALIYVESRFNPHAVSHMGARGMMQLLPQTAERFGVQNIHDPLENIEGGTRYLRFLLETFEGNTHLAIAGYNAGEGNVKYYGGIPPFSETQNFVPNVLSTYKRLKS
jgi:soluble lytic murein transglycosylase-like protein